MPKFGAILSNPAAQYILFTSLSAGASTVRSLGFALSHLRSGDKGFCGRTPYTERSFAPPDSRGRLSPRGL
jgi:hypothetical protein